MVGHSPGVRRAARAGDPGRRGRLAAATGRQPEPAGSGLGAPCSLTGSRHLVAVGPAACGEQRRRPAPCPRAIGAAAGASATAPTHVPGRVRSRAATDGGTRPSGCSLPPSGPPETRWPAVDRNRSMTRPPGRPGRLHRSELGGARLASWSGPTVAVLPPRSHLGRRRRQQARAGSTPMIAVTVRAPAGRTYRVATCGRRRGGRRGRKLVALARAGARVDSLGGLEVMVGPAAAAGRCRQGREQHGSTWNSPRTAAGKPSGGAADPRLHRLRLRGRCGDRVCDVVPCAVAFQEP